MLTFVRANIHNDGQMLSSNMNPSFWYANFTMQSYVETVRNINKRKTSQKTLT